MQSFKDLVVWQTAMDVVERTYVLARELPETERYGLRLQLQRSAVSIASNIAEGRGRRTDRDFARFLSMANGSACELETQLMVVQRLGLADAGAIDRTISDVSDVRRMLAGLSKRLTADG